MDASFTRYCKSHNLGHRCLENYFSELVDVEEKIDGSQFSFCLGEDGELHFRSRNRKFGLYDSHDLFANTVEYIESIRHSLVPGWTYRGEAMKGPKHNTLKYDRVPDGHLVLFDIAVGDCEYLSSDEVNFYARQLGFEPVPVLANNILIKSREQAESFLNRESVLGGVKVEGVVFKRRHKPTFNGRDTMIIAKLVSESFREAHKAGYKSEPRSRAALVDEVIQRFKTETRWQKAIQHMDEAGLLSREPRDIGILVKEIQRDVFEDHAEDIKNALFAAVRKQVERGIVKGFPEFYKSQIANQQAFGSESNDS